MARKRGMQYIPYDYEAAYNKAMEDMHEWFIENLFQHRKKVIYALKEITAGDQFEIEIYPQFRSMDEVPPEGRTIKKDNNKAQKNLNDKNARKYVERLINENFSDRDIWMTLTYDDAHIPPDGDVDAAIKNVQKYIRRINYQRKKRGLPNAKYVYVTAYNPDAEIRWHHHIVMDGALDMETVESCWKQSSRNEVRRLQTDENGLSGMANYIVEEKNRVPSEKRWNSSQGLTDGKSGVAVEVKCETDFVARGDKFQGFVKDMVAQVAKGEYADSEALLAAPFVADASVTVKEALDGVIATTGENMGLGKFAKMELAAGKSGLIGGFLHSNGKLAVLVEMQTGSDAAAASEAFHEVAKNVAMQIAAASPLAVSAEGLNPEVVEHEREVYRQKAREEGKPEQIIEKIAEGAVKKFCKDVCLLDQLYIRDDKMTISDLIKGAAKTIGEPITVIRFVRIQLGAE